MSARISDGAQGATAVLELVVGDDDTAVALGSGDVPVLGTPRLIALLEEATCAAVARFLAQGATSVGTRVEFDHLLPSPVGSVVRAEATLVRLEGSRLHFVVSAMQDGNVIARGEITRVVVDRERFVAAAVGSAAG